MALAAPVGRIFFIPPDFSGTVSGPVAMGQPSRSVAPHGSAGFGSATPSATARKGADDDQYFAGRSDHPVGGGEAASAAARRPEGQRQHTAPVVYSRLPRCPLGVSENWRHPLHQHACPPAILRRADRAGPRHRPRRTAFRMHAFPSFAGNSNGPGCASTGNRPWRDSTSELPIARAMGSFGSPVWPAPRKGRSFTLPHGSISASPVSRSAGPVPFEGISCE